ncbi:MIP/aquaporin family protein [Acidiphilium iwatense]|uniref:Aquaporin family protein n=1 Tax=Acidiphilium iwatense TaxID=768198 RepID=A0ABS9DYP4_9PROT|nr:MIP/aquaporin family protein [Acidiphilium iwatense]MCF3947865.1 aquaporin family protein [Acidiphilium iwatense]
MNRQLRGELISEAVAVFIIIAFGDSVAAMYFLYDPSPYQNAYWGVCMSWGMAVTLAIYVTGSISGTHANPAVTLALAMFRGFSWKKVIPYVVAQIVGAFVGAIVVYALFVPVINHFNDLHHFTRPESIQTAGVFFTHPGLAITPLHALSDQIILTAFLIFGIFAITEQYNEMAPGANFGAVMIGLLVAIIGSSMGYLEAWAINPARDFGPRVFAYLAGWGSGAFPGPGDYWWVPIVGPLIGGVIGGAAYQWLIHPYLPARVRAMEEERRRMGLNENPAE